MASAAGLGTGRRTPAAACIAKKSVSPGKVQMDERARTSYLTPMATRLLLTLLAVLTGLVAQLSPAQARACVGVNTEIGEAAETDAAQRSCTAVALACPPLQRQAWPLPAARMHVFVQPAPLVPAVLQGIDRARE